MTKALDILVFIIQAEQKLNLVDRMLPVKVKPGDRKTMRVHLNTIIENAECLLEYFETEEERQHG